MLLQTTISEFQSSGHYSIAVFQKSFVIIEYITGTCNVHELVFEMSQLGMLPPS